MKALKGKRGFYISVGILVVAIVGSVFLYKREADKTKSLRKGVEDLASQLSVIRDGNPTDEHKRSLQNQSIGIEKDYKAIVSELLQWNYVPETQVPAAIFVGDLRTTVGIIAVNAAKKQIVITSAAKNLGFDEFATFAPGPEEDMLQLQRELSAATDIAQLLIASDVYTIDLVARREQAQMEEGQTSPGAIVPGEFATTPSRRKSRKLDLYDVVAFRVKFTCKYPSLASFMRSLSTPRKTVVEEAGRRVNRPKNFLVINDLRFRVKQTDQEREEILRTSATERRSLSPAFATIPEDMPPSLGQSLLTRDTRAALLFFAGWRTWTPEDKRIFVLEHRLREQIPDEERLRLEGELNRMRRDRDQRKQLEGLGRPPQYNTIEVTMLIDLVQFNDKLIAEVQPEKAKPKETPPVTTASR